MKVLDANKLSGLAAALKSAGYRVIAPVRDGDVVRLMEWSDGAAIELKSIPVNSVKDILFPRSEIIGRHTLDGADFALQEVNPEARKTVALGVRPCDAASLGALDAVFNWDSQDEFFNSRRAACTVVPLACVSADEQCFCTSVGGGPDSQAGADAMLRFADGGNRLALEPVTEKGQAMAQAAGAILIEADAKLDAPAVVPVRFDARQVSEWCEANFDSPRWEEFSLACLGCGACAYACPTCHCFDIQDETTRKAGVRYRNWDACGLSLFTLHTSGHNPRPSQAARWRQRVMHKFSYFPGKFGLVACTGCGRCGRLCPAGMAILETCKAIGMEGPAPSGP